MKTACRLCARAALGLLVAGMAAWAMLALYYGDIGSEPVRAALAALFGLAAAGAFVLLPNRRRTLVCFCAAFVLIAAWWAAIKPSNGRDWQTDVAVLPWATVRGDLVTLHNIRNFSYRSETDYIPRYYDKTFDLAKLSSLDLIAVYWMGDAIAHIMLSFGFGGTDHVTFSIETRKEKGEDYSTIKGFFKQYELICIAGDERDLIRVRTDYRNPQENVYVYRLRGTPERARRLFMEYVNKINRLSTEPEFYNTLTTNCTTDVVFLAQAIGGKARYNWKILLSGYAPEYVYGLGGLETGLPFAELRRQSLINPRSHAIGDDPAFSAKIRKGLPGAGQR